MSRGLAKAYIVLLGKRLHEPTHLSVTMFAFRSVFQDVEPLVSLV